LTALQLGLFAPRWKLPATAAPRKAPWVDPFLAAHAETLRVADGKRLIFDEQEWNHGENSAVGVDIEIFRNFFIACFKRFADGKKLTFELSPRAALDRKRLAQMMLSNLLVTFNGAAYDIPLIYLALNGADNHALKEASDRIIHSNLPSWQNNIKTPRLNHIDLVNPNPAVRQGLKMLHGRLHGRYMVDLPYNPETVLTPEGMNVTTLYCFNDIDATELLYEAMKAPLEMRVALSREHRIDLRSKSDAQVGEAIVKKQVEIALGRRIDKPMASAPSFRYTPPAFIDFRGNLLKSVLQELCNTDFIITAGKVETPKLLQNLKISIGSSTYTMGIGGLHSTEAHRALKSDEERVLIDVDVASQYPNIIMKLGMYPQALGPAFLRVYGALIKTRLVAKAAGDKVRADGGRVAVNGVYGKLGSPYSVLYAPHLMIATTLTGQLSILMLIERAEAVDIPVVSANTDGVVFYCPRDKIEVLYGILNSWQEETDLVVEETRYKAIYNSSVNTYIAVKEDGKVKRKGAVADPWSEGDTRGQMSKNPQMTICSEAVVRLITEGKPIEETITSCKDPRAFVTVIKVTGGAVWRGAKIGRVVRYYWSLDSDQIHYSDGSRKVPKTNGAKPLSEMTDQLPEDIDYVRYCEEAINLANDLGINLLFT
jgi:hypothetical protein